MNHCHVRCVAEEHGRTMSPPQFAYTARVVIYLGLKKILSRRRVPHGTPCPARWSGGVGNWMSTLHGQWAGPIPEPREPKE